MSRIYKEFRFYPSEFKSVNYDNTMLVCHLSLEAVNDQFEMDQKALDAIFAEGYAEGKKDALAVLEDKHKVEIDRLESEIDRLKDQIYDLKDQLENPNER